MKKLIVVIVIVALVVVGILAFVCFSQSESSNATGSVVASVAQQGGETISEFEISE